MRYSVFCGSSNGIGDVYHNVASELGICLASNDIGVVYGGAHVGLMGAVADGALSAGGEVIGVLPTFLANVELAHKGLSELIIVETMHERKTKMNELCDGVIALPGGYGTFEEFFEMLTWGQLGLHTKPMAILNVNEFYTPLLTMLDNMVTCGFLKQVNRNMVLASDNIVDLLEQMKNYQAPKEGKWIKM